MILHCLKIFICFENDLLSGLNTLLSGPISITPHLLLRIEFSADAI